jgi:predicted aldo/keto reductase-like oxidoreductase
MKLTSRIGRTNLTVPTCGLGGIPLGKDHLTDEEGANLVRRAVDEGLAVIDTFCNYGRSEIRIGKALKGRRDKVTLITKSRCRFEPVKFAEMFEQSLIDLDVEYVDFLLLKNIDDDHSFANIERNMEVLKEFQRQGKVRYAGLSSHNPEFSIKAIQTGYMDVAEVPYNYANRHFEAVLDSAFDHDVGILAMKPLGGGRLFEEMEKGGKGSLETLIKALSFSLSHPSQPVLIPGIGTQAELDRYLEAIPRLEKLSEEAKDMLTEKAVELGADFCRACGYCVSVCPSGIPIDEILPLLDRVKSVRTDNTFKQVLRRNFEALRFNSNSCEECRKCIEECPYNLPIPDKIREAFSVFTERAD